jgi:hypothetical protein
VLKVLKYAQEKVVLKQEICDLQPSTRTAKPVLEIKAQVTSFEFSM